MWSSFTVLSAEVICAFILLLWLAYKYLTSNYTYWKDRSVPYVEPRFPFGTEKDFILVKVPSGEHYQNLYNKFKNEKMIGGYMVNEPYLMLRDPELLKLIMVKDFNHFSDRGFIDTELVCPLNRDLFILEGDAWKTMRTKLTPAFTSGKMKIMFHLVEACADEFKKALHSVADKDEKLDVKDFMARFTTDVISSCAFGLESNSIKNPDSEFRRNGKKTTEKPPLSFLIRLQIGIIIPQIHRLLHLSPICFNNGADDFFRNIVRDTVEYREKNGVIRNDFIDLLMKIKNNKSLYDEDNKGAANGTSNGNVEPGLKLDEMVAQALVFFIAGFETGSSTMTFCLYELSLNPNIQEKLHKEVNEVLQRHNQKINYQALQEMPYLDAVINETMRRYASLPFLTRKCTKEYKLPDSDHVIPKDMKIVIPTYAIHHDPKYYPDPYKFDPNRFLNDATKIKSNFAFLPFGEGPRMCIGSRFGLMQMKICLSMVIKNFRVSVTEDTPVSVKIDKTTLTTSPETPIILKISNRVSK